MARVILSPPGRPAVPVHVWSREPPPAAVAQLERIAAQPYVIGHVAGMPDLHVAHGVAVGTVFATDGVVVPSALGGDLGCGVMAVQLDLPAQALGRRGLQRILAGWVARIPVGDAVHRGKGATAPSDLLTQPLSTSSLEHARERLVRRQLGTLGGGNHFVELDRDMSGAVWLLVHSGSRGLGSAVGAHHLRAAESSGLGDVPGLSVDSDPGRACLADMSWALAFASANREALLASAALVVQEVAGATPDPSTRIDVHHNFVREEEHLGCKAWIHRKGAIAAPAGARVLIPGSMGTASYLALGLGEATSFASASHGAGRVMTRREARERIRVDRLARSMRRVVHDERRAPALVEEAPEAYREITEVLEDEVDLVRPIQRLEPLVVLKG
ncbi:RtcB family protein [Anaeromyxobacter oryzae]|uniref:3'-phosphate/5'-hydroxy nucleic acid ligase n=1 Tax=Anaeromyxobacter oryzae TaxID=2918170 RepID=A0ABN6MVI9_9BACT|nr:RtcB family protein [Anaeromyxobacter oryzae]BDG03538.1 RNA-splicing ligase RtcB [Anaeromyxobacter oryzae]